MAVLISLMHRIKFIDLHQFNQIECDIDCPKATVNPVEVDQREYHYVIEGDGNLEDFGPIDNKYSNFLTDLNPNQC